MWGSFSKEDADTVQRIAQLTGLRPLSREFVETDEHVVHYCDTVKAQIQDDVITLPDRLLGHAATRLAVAHALAQSAKISVFEGQGKALVNETVHMPRELAQHGHIALSRKQLSKMIGRLYMHKSQVNLMSSVLDTPEYFWTVQDWVEELYKALGNYFEVPERIGAVNARLEIVQDMLDMLQSRTDSRHGERLEWIVIVLVALEGLIGLLEFLGTIGLIRVPPGTWSSLSAAAFAPSSRTPPLMV